ncbi:MAG: bifunctional riboflavin kinase/FAD synthetase [Bacteroidia bacterium]|nr:bifunctional riboflavin kinase/FAD synthetase [Bacteroidia bacterium]
MQIHYDLNKFKANKAVVTIGTFDGVHLGHREVITELKRLSALSNGESVIFTFDPHPRKVLAPDESSLRLLSTTQEKIRLMDSLGIDHLVIYPFTTEFSRLSYDEFVTQILVNQLKMSILVVGYDHRFGQGRKGDFHSLQTLSNSLGFKVEQLSQLSVDNQTVSSSKIRMALDAGEVKLAKNYLGYNYTLTGEVVEGQKLGRQLGFPTANIDTHDSTKQVPQDGVYAVMVEVAGVLHQGMVNIGVRPTVNSNADHKTIEVHILDFNQDIYHTDITLHFVDKIREEQRFDGLDQLKKQLEQDQLTAQNILSE